MEMSQEPTMDPGEADTRARVLFGVVMVLLHVDEPAAVIEALRGEYHDTWTQGYYAGIEAWDLAHRANGPTAGPDDAA